MKNKTKEIKQEVKKEITKSVFLQNQKVACEKINIGGYSIGMFMPKSGICYRCKRNIVEELIKQGKDGTEPITGCPLCYISYCD